MSVAMAECGISWHTHDPGGVLTHLAVAIADGADCLADMAALREQSELFGPVASVPTAWRAVESVASVELREIPGAVAAAREKVWAASPPVGPITIDFDATLVTSFSEKQDAAPPISVASAFILSVPGVTPPASPWLPCCVRGTPGATMPITTSNCLIKRGVHCHLSTSSAMTWVTPPTWSSIRSWCGPTRLGPPTGLFDDWWRRTVTSRSDTP